MTTDATLRDRLMEDGYMLPTYRDHSIANIPETIASVLGVDADRPLPDETLPPKVTDGETPIDHVVMVVIDGFGWDRFMALVEQDPTLSVLAEHATITPLVSTYPSETASAMITLYTGLQPVEHGQLGWFSLFKPDDIIALSLPFSTRDGRPLDEAYGYDHTALFDHDPHETITGRLQRAGVEVSYVQPELIANSPTSRYVAGEATRIGFETVDEGFDTVRSRLDQDDGPTYQQLYYPRVDAAGHREGTRSMAYREALTAVLRPLEQQLLRGLDEEVAQRTLVLVVADHGQLDTAPDTNINIGQLEADDRLNLDAHLRRRPDGTRMYLAGSPRNVQFYTKDGHSELLCDELEAALPVRTFTRSEYIDAALFGDREPGQFFTARAPDVVAVPRDRGLWYDDGELDLIGMHGGLHPREMLVPFIALTPEDIR